MDYANISDGRSPEELVADNCDFRGTANAISNIGSLILVKQIEQGGFWIENHTTNGDALKK